MTESYALTNERAEQDRNPDRRSHLSVVGEDFDGDEFPLSYDAGPNNRCDMCGNWQAPEAGALCQWCTQDTRDDLDRKYRLENY